MDGDRQAKLVFCERNLMKLTLEACGRGKDIQWNSSIAKRNSSGEEIQFSVKCVLNERFVIKAENDMSFSMMKVKNIYFENFQYGKTTKLNALICQEEALAKI